ncbi:MULTISPECIES: substrate-binding domain-containing protein [Pseudomonas]|uniref:substrate-binding domain-containing protein n=1 Tax=Pseudomonas TaxID=286 RepID=UPI0008124696|nr:MULTISPECIES: substrate-binding domain-containing protein [unclassified Pseudomonas]MBW8129793.1 substrate-binding domain-containing protein [Pseudomonas sp. LAP_36]MBW8140006.1 substrate-binding domain-containing protein [Pseudomonas sp. PAMC 26818]CRM42946.1 Phosphate-binding protein [Pseudomonas sp. 24 E 1]CRM57551.1 Phosphate-binding protein [Pseudomonas sp. 58 R 12]CRM58125.1 Phosphate-binding protein [Pseudomonas sp. 24 R 17]
MFKRNVLAVSMTLASLCSAQAAFADVNGGGATLPQPLYQTAGVLTTGFAPYIGVGSGKGKLAFLNNDYSQFGTGTKNVHWAGSDSKLSSSELSTYASAKQPAWGKLIQVPSVATSVAIPFNKAGDANVDLSVQELCGVFSGRIVDWSEISGADRTGPITVVYRTDSSGTTELFTRFLNAKCTENGEFAITTSFGSSFAGGLPAGAVPATGSQGVMTALAAGDGRITYMSPDFAASTLEGLDDATKVARVGKNEETGAEGKSPAPGNVSAAIGQVPVPAATPASIRANQDNWVPVFGKNGVAGVQPYPTSGYPILGFTNLIFSQCYINADQTNQVRGFFTKHFGATANNDAAISANRFVPLPTSWKTAITETFVTSGSDLSIGKTNICNGKGRPL